jgi:hypothetical protein
MSNSTELDQYVSNAARQEFSELESPSWEWPDRDELCRSDGRPAHTAAHRHAVVMAARTMA